ncbi:MAG: DUF5131 family protein [Bellilinea sp.]
MSDRSKIEWCDATWNVLSGCTKISAGCKNCYAAELHDRRHKAYLKGAKLPAQYAKPFSEIQLHPERLDMPLHWKKLRRIFVNSTSDLFHPDVPDYFIGMVYAVAALSPNHTFMVLTKRPERIEKIFKRTSGEFWGTVRVNLLRKGYPLPDDETSIHPLPNVWLGVSVEDQKAADERIPLLLQTPAAVRFVSCEPLLGPVDLRLRRDNPCGHPGCFHHVSHPCEGCGYQAGRLPIDWVIVGGESGANARPMHPDWVRSIRDQCQAAGVKYFFKQWGGWKHNYFDHPSERSGWYPERVGKKAAGRLLDGRTWDEYPETVKQS